MSDDMKNDADFTRNTEEKPGAEGKRFGKEEFQDLKRFGSDILKKTMSSGLDALMDLKDGIPKEAAHFISARKDELLRGLTKEMAQSVINATIDTFFGVVRQHRLEISIAIRRNNDDARQPQQSNKPPSSKHSSGTTRRKK